MRRLFKRAASYFVGDELRSFVDRRIASALEARGLDTIDRKQSEHKPWKRNIYIPPIELFPRSAADPFMEFSTCSAADFFHPRYKELSETLKIPTILHRKYWEWVFILDRAIKHNLGTQMRALGFGVGSEPLPSVFAKMGAAVVGTDAPSEIGVGQGWAKDLQSFADSAEFLFRPNIVDRQTFDRNVTFAVCDMNDIGSQFENFDFCWSACCLEHLGSLQNGIDFIINSVEKTLKVGGIACHTTEFNVSSDEVTVENGVTVLYRKRDMLELVSKLRERGHLVSDISIAPNSHFLDFYVDTPPYAAPPHLKLDLYGFASTSIGLTITRGR